MKPCCFPDNLSQLQAGDHLCAIYDTEQEHRALLTPYLRQGLERNEKVIYIADARAAREIIEYLSDNGFDVNPYLERGQFSVLSDRNAYLREGNFDPDRMISLLRAETNEAIAEGYTALRVTEEMTWALGDAPGYERPIEYEIKLNAFFPGSRCLGLCQYDRRRFRPSVLLDVLTTHPMVVLRTELFENFYYMPPAQLNSDQAPAYRLEQWTSNLAARKSEKNALLASEQRFRALFTHMSNGLAIYEALADGEDFVFVDVNRAGEEIDRIKKKDLIGKKFTEIFPGVRESGLFEVFQRVWRTGRPEHPPVSFYADNRIQGWRKNVVYRLPSGEIVSIYEDITESKRMEEKQKQTERCLLQKQKMEAVGTLASGAAHEINNPINGIMNYAQLIKDRLDGHDPLQEYAAEIIRESERVGAIIQHLLSFAHQRPTRARHSTRLADIVNGLLPLIEGSLRENQIAIKIDIAEDLPPIECQTEQIQQVLTNLLANAQEALNEKSPGAAVNKMIAITGREIKKDGRWCLRVTVEDHGIGILEKTAEYIFDPFFTTKSRSEHSGLGLTVSQAIIREHGGQLTAEIEPGRSTRFLFDLPVEQDHHQLERSLT